MMTSVEAVVDCEPIEVVQVYVPAIFKVQFGRVGFCWLEEYPPGPVQE